MIFFRDFRLWPQTMRLFCETIQVEAQKWKSKFEIERLKAEGGYVTADVIDLHPTTANLDAMLAPARVCCGNPCFAFSAPLC